MWLPLCLEHRCSELKSSSLWIFPLRNMKWPYTSILINFVWKSILFNIRPIKPVWFLCPFPCKISSQTFTWKKIFQCWDMVFVCCKMMGSVFISILLSLCRFIRWLSSSMLRGINDQVLLIPVTLLLLVVVESACFSSFGVVGVWSFISCVLVV